MSACTFLKNLAFVGAAMLAAFSTCARAGEDAPFLWGVASASFQVEGSPADSDWLEWSHIPGQIKDGSNADVATDFWNRYDEDFALAHELGVNAYRISIAWERIEPERGQWDEGALAHYEKMIAAMRARGLEPVVTLLHSELPQWVAHRHGLLDPEFPEEFAEFAEVAVKRLSAAPAGVRYWMTINEPATQAEAKYLNGRDPSDFYDAQGKLVPIQNHYGYFLKAMAAQVRAHLAASERIHALGIPGLKLGVATDWTVIQAAGLNPVTRAVRAVAERIYDRYFLDGIVYGKNSLCPLGRALCRGFRLPDGKPSVEYIGVNYYTREIVTMKLDPPSIGFDYGDGPKSEEKGMEIYPPGLESALKAVWKDYRLPVLVSENGISDSQDQLRPKFLTDHLEYLRRAREVDQVPVIGYLYWSLTDNFNWSGGLVERYGLVGIDYSTLERKPRPSFSIFRDLIRQASRSKN